MLKCVNGPIPVRHAGSYAASCRKKPKCPSLSSKKKICNLKMGFETIYIVHSRFGDVSVVLICMKIG
jgi:hypothetical protein